MKHKVDRRLRDLCAAVAICALLALVWWTSSPSGRAPNRIEEQVMGFDVYFQLFDRKMYVERILPAYNAFLGSADVRPLVILLREAKEHLRDVEKSRQVSEFGILTPEDCAEDVDILEGRVAYTRHPSVRGERVGACMRTLPEDLDFFVRQHVAPGLVETLCLVRVPGVYPEQNLGRSLIVRYLYQHSPWLQEVLTFERTVTGGALEIPIGQSSEWVTRENVQRVHDELARIPRPQGSAELEGEFDNLREILRCALEDPNLAIVLTVG